MDVHLPKLWNDRPKKGSGHIHMYPVQIGFGIFHFLQLNGSENGASLHCERGFILALADSGVQKMSFPASMMCIGRYEKNN
jgi:hypothetical protein